MHVPRSFDALFSDSPFSLDEGASLRMGYEAILTSAVGESKARQMLADELMVRNTLSCVLEVFRELTE